MNPLPNIPVVQQLSKPVVDPVERSLAKPDAFCKPCSIGKAAPAKASQSKGTRIRTMDWKRKAGRPRTTPRDRRKVDFF